MKKLTVLLTLLCAASALNGMKVPAPKHEPERGHYVGLGMEDLPQEIQAIIISYLYAYDDLKLIIGAIKATSLTNKTLQQIIYARYGNQKAFTALIHMLADNFNMSTHAVADQFKTETSREYLRLADTLIKAIQDNDIVTVTNLITQDADVNYQSDALMTPLLYAVIELNDDIAQLLLDAGANPHFRHPTFGTPLDRVEWETVLRKGYRIPEIINIEKMLKEAMEKPSSNK